jgi:hypothetical protein
MKRRSIHRGMLAALVLAIVAGALGPQATRVQAGTVNFTNACTNSATLEANQVDVTLTGSAPASVDAGAQFQLAGISQTLFLPGALFVAGYNLGLLPEGQATVPGNVRTIIEATNTVEGTQTTPVINVSIVTTINDPDNIPGSGDETASPAEVTVNYPAQNWTAGGQRHHPLPGGDSHTTGREPGQHPHQHDHRRVPDRAVPLQPRYR